LARVVLLMFMFHKNVQIGSTSSVAKAVYQMFLTNRLNTIEDDLAVERIVNFD
jgi:hypothetical protein